MCRQLAGLNPRIVADLHAHTTASDGDDTPSRLAVRAKHAKLDVLAITDHDTVAGVAEAMTIPGITIVAGVELSVSFRDHEVHMLGLFVDPANADLRAVCDRISVSRRRRLRGYVEALASIGLPLPEHRVASVEAISTCPGRRHVANLLLEAGHIRQRSQAFVEVLPKVAGHVPGKDLVSIADAIDVVHRAGGLAILAHPPGEFDGAIYGELAALKLDGVESKHNGVSLTQTDFLKEQATRHGWVCTAGSDFHGADSPDRVPGRIGMTSAEYAAVARRAGR
jgi:hypothetical protein